MLLQLMAGVLLSATASPAAEPPTYWIIVNTSNPVATLGRDEVSRLFLRKASIWPGGRIVLPVDQIDSAPVREAFSKDIHRRSIAAIKSFWQQMIFSGRAVPPPELSSDAGVVAYVKAHPGAIGYVTENPTDGGVRVLAISG